MAGNRTLSARNNAAQDEWYTQLADIESELRHYRDQFRDKVVFCNCDDPYESNFFKYCTQVVRIPYRVRYTELNGSSARRIHTLLFEPRLGIQQNQPGRPRARNVSISIHEAASRGHTRISTTTRVCRSG